MVTGLDHAPGVSPKPPGAGNWGMADATLLAIPFLSSWAQFAPAFAASCWSLWLASWGFV